MSSRRIFLLEMLGLAGASVACEEKDEAPATPPGKQEPPLPEPPSRVLRFAVCSDGHYGQPATDFVLTHQNLVSWLNEEKAGKGLDLVVFNGDMIHDKPELLPPLAKVLEGLDAKYYVTRGNHDMVTDQLWQHTWGYLPNHTFETELYGFVLGDTSNEKGENIPVNREWLKTVLDAFEQKSRVFVFLHIPQGSWTSSGVKQSEAMLLMQSYENVCAVFHGHQHEKDGIEMSGGKHFIFDGHFGGNWGVPYHGYRIVEIDQKGSVTTYQRDPARGVIVNQTVISAL